MALTRKLLVDSLTTIYNSLFSSSATHNPITGVGGVDDPGASVVIDATRKELVNDQIAAVLYLENRIIQKVVDLVPEAAGFAEVVINGDINNDRATQIKKIITDLKVIQLFVQASISARLFRECYILIDNGDIDLSLPIDNSSETQILNLELFEFGQLRPIYNDNYTNRIGYSLNVETSDNETMTATLESETQSNSYVESIVSNVAIGTDIHPSRVLLFVGKRLSYKLQSVNNYYHAGILSGVINSFSQLKQSYAISSSLLARMITFVYKMSNLAERVANGDDYQIERRLKLHKKGIGSVGGLIIDKETEDVDWLTINLSGVQSIVAELKDIFTAETDLSHDQLWNEGSNDTASLIEDKNQRKKINNFIATSWQENFNALMQLIDGGDNITFTLALKDDEDLSSLVADRQLQATSDIAYINAGVLGADEVRTNRFSNGYSFDTTVTGDLSDEAKATLQQKNAASNQQQQSEGEDTQKKKSSSMQDASYKKNSDYKLTHNDVKEALEEIAKTNPILYALLVAEQDTDEKS